MQIWFNDEPLACADNLSVSALLTQGSVQDVTDADAAAEDEKKFEKDPSLMTKKEFDRLMHKLEKQMRAAAAELNFEMAAEIRDKITELKKQMKDD